MSPSKISSCIIHKLLELSRNCLVLCHFEANLFSCFLPNCFFQIIMEQILVSAAKQLEKQLDSEIDRLDNLGGDDIEAIRDRRLKEMKQRQEKIVQWKQNVKKKT